MKTTEFEVISAVASIRKREVVRSGATQRSFEGNETVLYPDYGADTRIYKCVPATDLHAHERSILLHGRFKN